MKYIVVIADGMADEALPQLDHRTPLEAARTPWMDRLAGLGMVGRIATQLPNELPESDRANMNLLGFDTAQYYAGRAGIEAAGMNIPIGRGDICYRMNLVTVSEDGKTLLDYAGGYPTDEEKDALVEALRPLLPEGMRLYRGVGYRQILTWQNGKEWSLPKPQEYVGEVLPEMAQPFYQLQKAAREVLLKHPVNLKRAAKGLPMANGIWFWGGGHSCVLPSFSVQHGLRAGVIAGVNVMKGLARAAGMAVPQVPGATGDKHTDYTAKAEAAVDLVLGGYDAAVIHIEAPDEASHQGSIEDKVLAIERIDEMVGQLVQQLTQAEERFRLAVTADHRSSVLQRKHIRGEVPFLVYDSGREVNGERGFYETAPAVLKGPLYFGTEFLQTAVWKQSEKGYEER
ncbi:MAG: alkaline phosphatase family protein [Lachnospiraceae bacterium]|nr:alkaline phosphatase family protein [Lachnospiraceae bacterium]MDY5742297.1 alkaline phosphatase family protein [Lachnospiraceae bacterium]